MAFYGARYRQGYSIGAGAVVLCGAKILLVQLVYGALKNQWAIPGGFTEPGETIDATIRREVLEETGVDGQVQGVIAVRSRVSPGDNSAYFIFLMRAQTEDARATSDEVLDARFFALDEIPSRPDVTPLTRILAANALEGTLRVLEPVVVAPYPSNEYILFM